MVFPFRAGRERLMQEFLSDDFYLYIPSPDKNERSKVKLLFRTKRNGSSVYIRRSTDIRQSQFMFISDQLITFAEVVGRQKQDKQDRQCPRIGFFSRYHFSTIRPMY